MLPTKPGAGIRAALLVKKNTRGWYVLPSTRVGALGVNAGARGVVRSPGVRPRTGMNLAPLFGHDARTLSRRLLRTRTRKSESKTLRSSADC